jgi:hypothetical protein
MKKWTREQEIEGVATAIELFKFAEYEEFKHMSKVELLVYFSDNDITEEEAAAYYKIKKDKAA